MRNSEPQISELKVVNPFPSRIQVDFKQDPEVDEEENGEIFTYLLPPSSPKAQAEKALRTILSVGHSPTHGHGFFEEIIEADGEVSFELKETCTQFVFHMPASIAGRSDEAISRVKEQNRKYETAVMNLQGCGTENSTQSFTQHSREMGTQKAAPKISNVSTQLHSYDLGTSLSQGSLWEAPIASNLKSEKSIDTMLTMEKIILQNALSANQKSDFLEEHKSAWDASRADDFDSEEKSDDLKARPKADNLGVEETSDELKSSSPRPRLEKACALSCKDTEGFPVNEITWNFSNQEMLVAAYGETKFGSSGPGRIALWTLKNTAYPEKIVKTKSSCTCIQFSPSLPYLLAAGFFDGTIQIYDIRTEIPQTVMSCADLGRHQQPVWQVAWVTEKEEDDFRKNDVQHLLSIGGDGVIKQWSLRGAVATSCVDLMRLKRVANPARLKGSSNADHVSSFQEAMGSALMTSNTDNIYYVATDDGVVHKCSVSYKEQALKSYFGHFRRIHQLKSSPFNSEYFMTCSEDWTINLWSTESEKPLIKLEPGPSSVRDCDWCPFNSCVIASCLHNGKILVWDLSRNQKDATITFETDNSNLSSIQFSPKHPQIYAGDSDGTILCFHLKDVEYLPVEDASTAKRSIAKLQRCMLKS